MSDLNWIALTLALWGLTWLYGSSRPAWVVRLWEQITRPIRWIERKVGRNS